MNRENICEEEKSQACADIQYLSDEVLEQISDQIIRQYHDVYYQRIWWYLWH